MSSNVADLIAQAQRNEILNWLSRDLGTLAAEMRAMGVSPVALMALAQLMQAPGEPISPPNSWEKDAKAQWAALPRGLQEYVSFRELERDRAVRRAQNEAAELRNELKKRTAAEPQHPQADQEQLAAKV
jgi:hypothetical protein